LHEIESAHRVPAAPQAIANFDPHFMAAFREAMWRDGEPRERREHTSMVGAENLFAYIYALFHSPAYRRRYADCLQLDFPRILVPRSPTLFQALAKIGAVLITQHLLASAAQPFAALAGPGAQRMEPPRFALRGTGLECVRIGRGFPKYHGTAVRLNRDASIEGVAPEVWAFRVGGHQVCRKWLRDRRGRLLNGPELTQYVRLLAAVEDTVRLMSEIDLRIEQHGGWPAAFASPAKSS
jgi:hypothetical protein